MSAEYEGWTVWCDYVGPNGGTLSSRLAARCHAQIKFDAPGVSEDGLYDRLDKAGWTGDDSEHDYCPEHPDGLVSAAPGADQ